MTSGGANSTWLNKLPVSAMLCKVKERFWRRFMPVNEMIY